MSALGGWWRIWIVVMLASFAFGTIVGLDQRQFDNDLSEKRACFPGTLKTRMVSEPVMDSWEAYQKTPPEALAGGELINPRVEVEHFSCVSWWLMLRCWGIALAAALALPAVIFLVRWICAGFARSQT